MRQNKKIVFYHCYTPLHIGSGTTLDIIDLPIQREAHTDFPIIPSTVIKGVIRANYWIANFNNVNIPDSCNNSGNSSDKCDEFFSLFGCKEKEGRIVFTDAKIFLFPVKSIKGIFAWITSPFILERFSRDTGKKIEGLQEIRRQLSNQKAIIGENVRVSDNFLLLEELSFEGSKDGDRILEEISNLLPKKMYTDVGNNITKNIAILSDDSFRYFVKNHTEVNARIKIDQELGTVKEGGLWYEELVPTETIFYGLIFSRDSIYNTSNDANLEKITNFIDDRLFQFGGDETLGRGFTKVYIRE
jgi:CRISPR-associated protein Cmr4